MNNQKIYIIANEASGDNIAHNLIDELQKLNPLCEVRGVFSDRNKNNVTSFMDYKNLAIMGFLEVIKHLFKLYKIKNQIIEDILLYKPDVLITIDAPSMNFRIVEHVKSFNLSMKYIHFVSPSIWAYKENRKYKVSKLYDLLLCILPFEPKYYENLDIKVKYIGHPFFHEVKVNNDWKDVNLDEFKLKYQVHDFAKFIVLTPGSRLQEIKAHLSYMIDTLNKLNKDDYQFVALIPCVNQDTKTLVSDLLNSNNIDFKYRLIDNNDRYIAYKLSSLSIAKSGTNVTEIANFNIPIVTIYKMNFLTYFIAKLLIKCKYISVINLVLNTEVIKELVQNDINNLYDYAKPYIDQSIDLSTYKANLDQALTILGKYEKESPIEKAAKEILSLLV